MRNILLSQTASFESVATFRSRETEREVSVFRSHSGKRRFFRRILKNFFAARLLSEDGVHSATVSVAEGDCKRVRCVVGAGNLMEF